MQFSDVLKELSNSFDGWGCRNDSSSISLFLQDEFARIYGCFVWCDTGNCIDFGNIWEYADCGGYET